MDSLEKLKFLRFSHDFSLSYVAHRLNMSKEEYKNIEQGEGSLTLKDAEILSKLYEIHPLELFEEEALKEALEEKGDSNDVILYRETYDLAEYTTISQEKLVTMNTLQEELWEIKAMLRALTEKLTQCQ